MANIYMQYQFGRTYTGLAVSVLPRKAKDECKSSANPYLCLDLL